MNSKNATPIPGAIEQLQRQLDEFRSTQPHRKKLPETLWQAAVELARHHGVYSVAHPLRLDYVVLHSFPSVFPYGSESRRFGFDDKFIPTRDSTEFV